MLYHTYPMWEQLRAAFLEIPPSTPALTVFSRKVLERSIADKSRYDCGVSGSTQMTFLQHVDIKFFYESYYTWTQVCGSTYPLTNYVLAEWRMTSILATLIESYISSLAVSEGNHAATLRFYTMNDMPLFDDKFNYPLKTALPFLPEERIIPMRAIHSMILETDKQKFTEKVNSDI